MMVVQVQQLAREEDDGGGGGGGGVALKDCFAKDLSFVIVLLVFFFFLGWICHLSKGFFLLSRFMNCFVG